ncbi:hypothetical protein C2845_PM07G27200 [Panicum miliaceum]|uniref:WRKY domain-containing protein n=1 Tax=Panicum miliaceum TaxID=4540 RepID=A0A3L6SSM3_PANMI|nr:hypothetical protein C2845_PM07G27200 [Panicum miliaceum]
MTTSSSGSIEAPANSRPGSFSFASTSFTDMLGGSAAAAGGASRYKAMTPPSLPLSPPPVSPSSFFNIPGGLNSADFLDSPALLTSSFFPSPTTNAFASQQFSWLTPQGSEQGGKDEQRQSYPDFSFQTAPTTEEAVRTTTTFQQPPVAPAPLGEEAYRSQQQQQPWGYQQQQPGMDAGSSQAAYGGTFQAGSSDAAAMALHAPASGGYSQAQSQRRSSDDGYNWRKYGQKQVGGGEASEHSFGGTPVAKPENSSASFGDDEAGVGSPRAGNAGGDEFDEDEPDSKRCAALYRPAPPPADTAYLGAAPMAYQTGQQYGFGGPSRSSFGHGGGSFGFPSGFDNPMGSYMSQHQQQQRQNDAMHASRAKEEPREDMAFFPQSMMYN